MKKQIFWVAFGLACSMASIAQTTTAQGDTSMFNFTVVPAPEWTKLFIRDSGWFGGDAVYSIPLSGVDRNNNEGNDSTLLLFGDSYFGQVNGGRPLPGNVMVNNSVAYIRGNDPAVSGLQFYTKFSSSGKPESFFVPRGNSTQKPRLFWPGDGFVNKEKANTLYFLGYKVERTGANVFDFIEPAVAILAVSDPGKPPFAGYREIETSLHINNEQLGEGNLGAGLLVNTQWAGAPSPDGFVYIYGCLGKDKHLVVARVRPSAFEDEKAWRFYDGKGWSAAINDLKPVTNGVSNELSMTPLPDGRFLLTFQVMGLSDKIGVRVAASPTGPFSAIREIYTTPEWQQGLWTYNAKAHPNLSRPGELLISYNTITADFWNDIQKDARI